MGVVALVDRSPRSRPIRRSARSTGWLSRSKILDLVVGDDRPVAFVEIGDALGQAGQRRARPSRDRILAVAVADGERRAQAGADDHAGMVAEQDGEREGAVQARQHRRDRASRALARRELVGDEMGDDLAVGLALEGAALGLHLLAQRLEILDDAVVDDRDAVDDVRVGVADGRRAVGRPAGVGDADRAGERRRLELALRDCRACPRRGGARAGRRRWCRCRRCHSRDIRAACSPSISRADTSARPTMPIIPHIRYAFPHLQAHACRFSRFFLACMRSRNAAARPGFSTCSPRPSATASAATSRVITEPAPTERALADRDRRDQRAVRADERALADHSSDI